MSLTRFALLLVGESYIQALGCDDVPLARKIEGKVGLLFSTVSDLKRDSNRELASVLLSADVIWVVTDGVVATNFKGGVVTDRDKLFVFFFS